MSFLLLECFLFVVLLILSLISEEKDALQWLSRPPNQIKTLFLADDVEGLAVALVNFGFEFYCQDH